mmetsp:Transcript_15170/g.44696  ORF Transcript_15170/g.44696 Transcript_15170/m.44696 type:complete len:201 (-) Transcript_15170:124-726(-)|eukprot:365028-Chlamydomonas_euryale.AAC.23
MPACLALASRAAVTGATMIKPDSVDAFGFGIERVDAAARRWPAVTPAARGAHSPGPMLRSAAAAAGCDCRAITPRGRTKGESAAAACCGTCSAAVAQAAHEAIPSPPSGPTLELRKLGFSGDAPGLQERDAARTSRRGDCHARSPAPAPSPSLPSDSLALAPASVDSAAAVCCANMRRTDESASIAPDVVAGTGACTCCA